MKFRWWGGVSIAALFAGIVPACDADEDAVGPPSSPIGDASAEASVTDADEAWDGTGPPPFGSSDAKADVAPAPPTKCNSLTAPPAVGQTAGAGTKPTPAGGPIADGTYVLTKVEVWAPGSPGTETQSAVLRVTGNAFDVLTQIDDGPIYTRTGTYSIAGDELTLTDSCPFFETGLPIVFTATPTQVMIFGQSTPLPVSTFTKQ